MAWKLDIWQGTVRPEAHAAMFAHGARPDGWAREITRRLQEVLDGIRMRQGSYKLRRSDFEALRRAIGRGMYGEQ